MAKKGTGSKSKSKGLGHPGKGIGKIPSSGIGKASKTLLKR